MSEQELMSLRDLTEIKRKIYHYYHGSNEPAPTDLELNAVVETARAAHEWKADYEAAQWGFEAQLARSFELVEENKKLREQLDMVNTSANISAGLVKCLQLLRQIAANELIKMREALKDARGALAACSFEPLPHELINQAIAKIDALDGVVEMVDTPSNSRALPLPHSNI